MPVGQQDHGRIAVAIAVAACGLHQPFDLTLSEVFACAVVRVRQSPVLNCSLYRGWCTVLDCRIHGHLTQLLISDSFYNVLYRNSCKASVAAVGDNSGCDLRGNDGFLGTNVYRRKQAARAPQRVPLNLQIAMAARGRFVIGNLGNGLRPAAKY